MFIIITTLKADYFVLINITLNVPGGHSLMGLFAESLLYFHLIKDDHEKQRRYSVNSVGLLGIGLAAGFHDQEYCTC